MQSAKPARNALLAGLVSAVAMGGSAVSHAEDGATIEEVVVTGSRRPARSATQTPAPVDVIGGSDFENVGNQDMDSLLRSLVPSYNVSQQPINDESTLIRPANLRGLPPDNTLILVNGKRRHRGGIISFLGDGVSDGAQGPDVSVIPSIALDQVQVLRDGAAAQYGSDAIAGVINFMLKDDAEGASVEARYGQFYEGDGESVQISGNVGLPLGDSGYLNLSAEYNDNGDTSRSAQRADAQGLIDAGNTAVADPAQVWGAPKLIDGIKLFANAGFDVNEQVQVYAFGNYATKEVDGGFFFRNPNTRGAVFSTDGGQTLLVGDLDTTNAVTCPTINIVNNVPDPGPFAEVTTGALDAECFVFNELFPGGFTPRFGGDVEDFSIVGGVRGELNNGLRYDASVSHGASEVDFFINNTVNASLGPNTPTEFDPGLNRQTETNINLDLSYPVKVDAFASDLNVAFGFEYRDEEFEVEIGQLESFQIGPLATQGFSSGSNGFSGFGPQSEGKFSRDNIALYLDLEADVTEQLILGAAVRWEDFSDFGTTTNFKLAGHYTFNEQVSARATVSTGFRAPTPGQSNIVRTITQIVNGVLNETGVLPPTNQIVQDLSTVASGGNFTAEPLDPEESVNWTLGLILALDQLDVTIDYFNIQLDDRIALTSLVSIDRTDPAQLAILDQLNASGVPGATTLTGFQFFTNDFETKTQGIDIVATTSMPMGQGTTDLSFAFNWTDTKLEEQTLLVGANREIELEDQLPNVRFVATATHLWDAWRFMVRGNYHDGITVAGDIGGDATGTFDGKYGGEFTVDAEVAYTFEDRYTVVLGAQNLFDNEPDRFPNPELNSGQVFPEQAPFGFNGGFWYLRLRADL